MAILAGIASLLGRFAGRVLNTTLGWATLLLFGRVPASRQSLLLVIVFGALVWLALIVGVVYLVIAAILARMGMNGLKAASLAPTRTVRSVREDAHAVKETFNGQR